LSTLIPLLVLLALGLFPVQFHLHYHRQGKADHFFLELRIHPFYRWRYQIPVLEREGFNTVHQKTVESVERMNGEEIKVGESRIRADTFLASLAQIGGAIKKYGLGGTFFYYFLPKNYRKWVTVTERLERKGCFKRFFWRTTFGGLEPALLGPTVGLIWNAKGVIVGFLTNEYLFKKLPRILVVPCFTEPTWETMLDCIFEIKLGHIIVAGIKDYLIQLVGGKKHAGTPD
jgi:hypothetical protein